MIKTRQSSSAQIWRIAAKTSVLVLVLAAAGCVHLKPWERGELMQECMQGTVDPLSTALDVHVFRTREAMLGAETGAGVSCGCN